MSKAFVYDLGIKSKYFDTYFNNFFLYGSVSSFVRDYGQFLLVHSSIRECVLEFDSNRRESKPKHVINIHRFCMRT